MIHDVFLKKWFAHLTVMARHHFSVRKKLHLQLLTSYNSLNHGQTSLHISLSSGAAAARSRIPRTCLSRDFWSVTSEIDGRWSDEIGMAGIRFGSESHPVKGHGLMNDFTGDLYWD